ncbi:hypothetical protein ABT369_37555 [Dactylosporangium sp. NPDC000244]|uniref:hypothetical protein n=1 Tax=Dactylosporangium sp. NPDC000244 TaxID=3154365 RepID=UPI003329E186
MDRDLPFDERRRCYRRIVSAQAAERAEALIEPIRESYGDAEAARLLSACGPAVLARLLPELSYALPNPARFGRYRPAALLTEAARQLRDLPASERSSWWYRWYRAVFAAARTHPGEAMELLERYAPAGHVFGLHELAPLAAAHPDRLVDVLTAPGRAAWLRYQRLPEGLLRRLGPDPAARLLRAAPPRDRSAPSVADARRIPALPPPVRLGALPEPARHRAIELWLRDPSTRAERAGAVFAADPANLAAPGLWRAVAARRPDLLDAALAGPFPLVRVRRRDWEPRHVAAYAARLDSITRDPGRPAAQRNAALRLLATSPDLGRPSLTGRPGEERDWVALGLARHLPPSEAGPLLASVRGSVSGQQQAVRLLAHLALPDGPEVLWRRWQEPDLHRDVRAAIVEAARRHPDRPGLWRILRAATAREDVAPILAAIPADVPESRRLDYGALIAAACDSPDDATAVAAWAAFPAWARYIPNPAFLERLTDLEDDRVWRATARALAVSDTPADLMTEVLRALAALGVPGRRRIELIAEIRTSNPAVS